MPYGKNDVAESTGQSTEELTERAAQAIAREWGITEDEARAAIARCRKDLASPKRKALTPEAAAARRWAEGAPLFDLTDPATRAAYYRQKL